MGPHLLVPFPHWIYSSSEIMRPIKEEGGKMLGWGQVEGEGKGRKSGTERDGVMSETILGGMMMTARFDQNHYDGS